MENKNINTTPTPATATAITAKVKTVDYVTEALLNTATPAPAPAPALKLRDIFPDYDTHPKAQRDAMRKEFKRYTTCVSFIRDKVIVYLADGVKDGKKEDTVSSAGRLNALYSSLKDYNARYGKLTHTVCNTNANATIRPVRINASFVNSILSMVKAVSVSTKGEYRLMSESSFRRTFEFVYRSALMDGLKDYSVIKREETERILAKKFEQDLRKKARENADKAGK